MENNSLVPAGLPGGFFIYNALGDNELLFADENLIRLFGCNTFQELQEFTHNSFKGMVHFDDYKKIDTSHMSNNTFIDTTFDAIDTLLISDTELISYKSY